MCLLQPNGCFFATREFELYLHKITIEPMTRVYLIPIILVLLLAVGCHHADDRLVGLDAISDSAPQAVLDSLACIDRATLSEADRHYYDFLSVKAADKAYLTHSSDSLILSVVDYASNHQSHGYYPEALYYCGRVYSDLGDYPTALTYFHQALDQLPEVAANRKLRGNIISQTGRLLINLRLYDQAVTYLDKVIEMERQDSDTTNLVLDLQLLGHLYINSGQYDKAQKTITESLLLSRNLKPSHAAVSRMYLANIKYLQGDCDSALIYLRCTKDEVDPIDRNAVLASGARIFLKAEILDSAYWYAHSLINSQYSVNKEIGYNRILTRSLRKYLQQDTVYRYVYEYVSLLENFYNENQSKMVIAQQAMYNYNNHEKARRKAENSRELILYFLKGALVLILIVIIWLLILKNKNQKNLIRLHVALDEMESLKRQLENQENTTLNYSKTDNNEASLREKLRNTILNLNTDKYDDGFVPDAILNSNVYNTIMEYINQSMPIPEKSEIWNELENVVFGSSPNLKNIIKILAGRKLTEIDLKTLLLIRCGISPTNMSLLCQRERGSINSRRKVLSNKLFGKDMDIARFDKIIRII